MKTLRLFCPLVLLLTLTLPILNAACVTRRDETVQWSQAVIDQQLLTLLERGWGRDDDTTVVDEVRELHTKHHASIHAHNAHKKSALHIAIAGNHIAVAEYLIASGAAVDTVDDENNTLLHATVVASSRYNKDSERLPLVDMLLTAGAPLDTINKQGRTALHLAISHKMIYLARRLLEAGAHANTMDKQGKTLIHLAMDCDLYELIKRLIKAGVNINALDGGKILEDGTVVEHSKTMLDRLYPGRTSGSKLFEWLRSCGAQYAHEIDLEAID